MKNNKFKILIINTIIFLSGCVSTTSNMYWNHLQFKYDSFDSSGNIHQWDITHYYAAIGTKEELLEVLIHSDNIDNTDLNGNTPVMIAQRYNNLETFDLLLSEGCSLEWIDCFSPDNRKEAIEIAISYNYFIDNCNKSNKKVLPSVSFDNFLPPNLEYNYFSNITENPFCPNDIKFSYVNSWFLSECSFLAYASTDFVKSTYKKAGYDNFKFFSINDNECMIIWDSETIIISFRGTEINSPSFTNDVITDLNTDLVEYEKGGYIHKGFLTAFNTLWKGRYGLEYFINELKIDNNKRAIWVTGHSMGGALADICFTQMEDATGLYTFGAPRIGDLDFLKLTQGRPMWRVEHDQDPVTTVPFTLPEIGSHYYNLGNLIYISKYGQVLDLSKTQISIEHKNYVPDIIDQELFNIIDHMPINYSVKLWNSFN